MPEDLSRNLSDSELKFSYWFITNKLKLKKALIIFLIVLAVFLWLYIILQLAFYAFSYSSERKGLEQLIFGENQLLATIQAGAPKQLSLSDAKVLLSSGGRSDIVTQIANSNRNWLATFDYNLMAGANKSDISQGFVLPGETKYLLYLGSSADSGQIQLSNIKWQKIKDFEKIRNLRSRFEITKQESKKDLAEGITQFSIEVVNRSAFSFWQAGFQVLLYNGGEIIGANSFTFDQFKSGEARSATLNWADAPNNFDSIEVIPDINIIDDKNIMPPQA